MIGTPKKTAAHGASMPIPSAAAASAAASRDGAHPLTTAFILAGLVVLYLVYAVLERHEKLAGAIKGQNMALNLRNLAVMLATVVIGINLLKVLGVKLVAWGIPGAKHFLSFVGNA